MVLKQFDDKRLELKLLQLIPFVGTFNASIKFVERRRTDIHNTFIMPKAEPIEEEGHLAVLMGNGALKVKMREVKLSKGLVHARMTDLNHVGTPTPLVKRYLRNNHFR